MASVRPGLAERRRLAYAALERLPLEDLRDLWVRHHFGSAALSKAGEQGATELVTALVRILSRCPICLSEADASEKAVYRCDGCAAPFHSRCIANHALSAAEVGRLPLSCPVFGCQDRWQERFIAGVLSNVERERYNTAARNLQELRLSAGTSQTQVAVSPRTAATLESMGMRACPHCRTMVEKQDAGPAYSCDNMTCRCGCKFCYRCGTIAGPGGLPRCPCVGQHHGYVPQEEVLRNYDENDGRSRCARRACNCLCGVCCFLLCVLLCPVIAWIIYFTTAVCLETNEGTHALWMAVGELAVLLPAVCVIVTQMDKAYSKALLLFSSRRGGAHASARQSASVPLLDESRQDFETLLPLPIHSWVERIERQKRSKRMHQYCFGALLVIIPSLLAVTLEVAIIRDVRQCFGARQLLLSRR